MPTPAEELTANSSEKSIEDAISRTIRMLMHEGRKQNQAIAIAYSQARGATGKQLRRVGRTGRRPKVRRWTAR